MNARLMPYGLLTVLFKHKTAALWVFSVIVLCGVAYLLLATPRYQSVAELVVRFGDRSIPDLGRAPTTEMTPSDRREIVLSHAAILQSHDLAQEAIAAFGIDKVYPDIAENPPGAGTPMDAAVKKFDANLAVDVGTQDNVITVSFLHPDAKLAPKLVHKLIDLYIGQETKVYQNPQSEFLAHEVKDAQTRLASAQSALESFKGKLHITDYDKEVEDLLKQRGDVDTNLRAAEAAYSQSQQRQQELSTLLKTVPEKLPEAASGEKYRGLDDAETKLGDLKTKESQMLATYRSDSPALLSLKAGIANAEAEVKARRAELNNRSLTNVNTVYQTLQTDYLRTSADASSESQPVRVLSGQLKMIDDRLGELQQNRGTFLDLVREDQIAEDTYRSLSTQYEDARVKDNLNKQRISPATVISQPTLPYKPARPRKLVTLVACLFAGTILAIGCALALEALDDRFTTAEQVVFILDLPVLASFGQRQRSVPRVLIEHGGSA
ncbi:MAG TPA: Wzz/FepE/Etk N-terminal domain-containing protein [Stellaceae bacterium]|jgi:uncharacterized protein involved in exopolysaccharide biosynthesis|nr:Wzz/FepE/Etk N-terminal domain-containing protein [Stellaceae bacterium]